MARTPLLRHLLRSLQLARLAQARGLAPLEVVQRAEEARALSRRRLLQGTGALAAVGVLDGCASAPKARAGTDEDGVLIIGAGIAGLTAAWRLRQAGVAVRLFEAQARVGGRMFSLRDHFADGQVAELGGEFIDTGHEHLRRLAGELGLVLDDLTQDTPGLATDVWFFGGERRSETALVEAFLPVAARIQADLGTLADADGETGYRSPNNAQALDRTPLAEWLERHVPEGWLRTLLEVGYTAEYGLEVGEQSALNLLMMIGVEAPPFRIYGESDERFHVRGGNDAIPRTLAGRLEDALALETRLEAVRVRADGRYACTLRRGGRSFTQVGAQVVLALPFTLLREVRLEVELPEVKRRAIEGLRYGTNAKLMVGFGERVWRTRHGSNGSTLTDLPYQVTWETSRQQPGRAGLLTNFTGGRAGVALGEGEVGAQAARLTRELERVFPGVAQAREGMKEARFHWPSFPFTRGSYACYGPGDWTGFGGVEGEPVGGLFFAGEHCSRGAQGYMEGGCQTGEHVARALLEARGARRAALAG
jgi:monoamine oxidase